jgi:cytochrome c-type biogenesis protein CcmH/NrfG
VVRLRGSGVRLAVLAAVAWLLWTAVAAAQEAPTLERARVLYDAGRITDARVMLEELTRTQTSDPGVYLLLGVVQRRAKDLPAAIASLDRAHALDPRSTQFAVELATTLAWHGDLDRATDLYRQVLAADPSHAGARAGLGFALAWQGRLDQAGAVFRELTGSNPRSVDGWNGLGFVDRAALRRGDAESAYRRALELDPQNTDAAAGLRELHWDRRTDVQVLGGGSVVPDGAWEPETRIAITHAINPRVTIGGGYQRYAFGAVLPIGGVDSEDSTRSEDSLEASVTLRPTRRLTLGNGLYTFFSDETKRGMLWEEAVFALTPRLSLIGDFRPAFSSDQPHWLMAGALGASVSVTSGSRLSARALIAADTTYEPRLTVLADYAATISRRFQMQMSVADSHSDERFAFTSVAATASWLMTPAIGLSVTANHRTETFERSEVLLGVVVRR